MGFFGLFSKKEKNENEEKAPEKERIYKETPFGRFIYVEYGDEHGYEGDIPAIDGSDDPIDQVAVFFQTDSVDTMEAHVTYQRFSDLMQDRQRSEFELKQALAHHFLFKEGKVDSSKTLDEITESLKITGYYIYVNESQISVQGDIYVDDLCLIIFPDGSKEVRFVSYDDGEKHTESLGG
ncbi:MAG: hypothetical protein IJ129_00395 [Ruminococcus sp.]|nr:hypothetical protein [Ruminococcus sp.]